MNLVNSRRSELSDTPYLNRALDDITSRANVVFTKEHTPDGEHTDVTAQSVTVANALTVDGTVEGPLNFGTAEDPILLDGDPVGPGAFTETDDYPAATVIADTTKHALSAYDLIPAEDDTHYLGYVDAGDFRRRWRSLYFSKVVYGPKIVASTAFYERNRFAPLGEWTPVAFSAANFTGSGAMTWTLVAGDQVRYAYTLIGKTIIIDYVFATTSCSGGDTALLVAAPGGVTFASATHQMNVAVAADNGAVVDAYVQVVDGAHWGFLKRDGTAWTAAADTTAVQGTFIASIS